MESFLEKRELNFNKFVIDYLQPTRESNDRVKQIIDSVKSFVQHNTGYKIQRVVKVWILNLYFFLLLNHHK